MLISVPLLYFYDMIMEWISDLASSENVTFYI